VGETEGEEEGAGASANVRTRRALEGKLLEEVLADFDMDDFERL
jgi:hypothetical protein